MSEVCSSSFTCESQHLGKHGPFITTWEVELKIINQLKQRKNNVVHKLFRCHRAHGVHDCAAINK